MEYITQIVKATRQNPHLSLGASPRGSLALMRASQALAFLKGHEFVDPYLIKQVAQPVLAHRLLIKPQSRLQGVTQSKIVDELLDITPVPVAA